jgi:hypothetical protein
MIGDVRRGLISGACGILALAIPPSRHVCMCAQGCVLGGNRFVGSSLVIVDVVIVVCVRACGGRCRCVIQCLRSALSPACVQFGLSWIIHPRTRSIGTTRRHRRQS